MPGPKTNEREGTRAVLRYSKMSAFKVREVLDAIRGKPVREAADLLRFVERDAAIVIEKLLNSAVANATNNDDQDPDELFVSACYADEGPTVKRWRPRARGRAARIRKRSCHITLIVSRLPEERLARLQARRHAENLALRARRVEATRRARSEAARAEAGEGASRRERRHPVPEEQAEGATELTMAPGAVEQEQATEPAGLAEPEAQGDEVAGAGPQSPDAGAEASGEGGPDQEKGS
jgi:large subunit ribosomal protein L22